MTKKPKFSVIVGFYNQISTLPKLLESLSKQTFQDFEILICDDVSSKDQTPLITHPVTARHSYQAYQTEEKEMVGWYDEYGNKKKQKAIIVYSLWLIHFLKRTILNCWIVR